jgi:hypothetical protein
MRYRTDFRNPANLPALQAVLEHLTHRGDTDATYHLDDLVGCASWPNETISLLRGFRIDGGSGQLRLHVADGLQALRLQVDLDQAIQAIRVSCFARRFRGVSRHGRHAARSETAADAG